MWLLEKGKLISDQSKVADSCNNLFENAIQPLGIKANGHSNESYGLNNIVEIAIKNWLALTDKFYHRKCLK